MMKCEPFMSSLQVYILLYNSPSDRLVIHYSNGSQSPGNEYKGRVNILLSSFFFFFLANQLVPFEKKAGCGIVHDREHSL